MKCPYCGEEIEESLKECPNCGAALGSEDEKKEDVIVDASDEISGVEDIEDETDIIENEEDSKEEAEDITVEQTQETVSTKKTHIGLFITAAIGVIVIVAVVVFIVPMFSGNNPTEVAEKCGYAYMSGDYVDADKNEAITLQDKLDYYVDNGTYKDEKEIFELLSKEYESGFTDIKEYYEVVKEESTNSLKTNYGDDYKISIKVTDVKDMTEDEYQSVLSSIDEDELLKQNIDVKSIKDNAIVSLEYEVKGSKNSYSDNTTLQLLKIGNRWKVFNN